MVPPDVFPQCFVVVWQLSFLSQRPLIPDKTMEGCGSGESQFRSWVFSGERYHISVRLLPAAGLQLVCFCWIWMLAAVVPHLLQLPETSEVSFQLFILVFIFLFVQEGDCSDDWCSGSGSRHVAIDYPAYFVEVCHQVDVVFVQNIRLSHSALGHSRSAEQDLYGLLAEFSGVCPRSLVLHKLEKVWIVIVWNIRTDVDILDHVAGDRK